MPAFHQVKSKNPRRVLDPSSHIHTSLPEPELNAAAIALFWQFQLQHPTDTKVAKDWPKHPAVLLQELECDATRSRRVAPAWGPAGHQENASQIPGLTFKTITPYRESIYTKISVHTRLLYYDGTFVCIIYIYIQCVYIPTYVCTYVRMHVSIYLPTYLSIYLSIYLSMYLCMYLCIYVCIYVSMYVSMFVSMYVSMCVSMCVSMYVSMCVSMYVLMHGCIDVWMC